MFVQRWDWQLYEASTWEIMRHLQIPIVASNFHFEMSSESLGNGRWNVTNTTRFTVQLAYLDIRRNPCMSKAVLHCTDFHLIGWVCFYSSSYKFRLFSRLAKLISTQAACPEDKYTLILADSHCAIFFAEHSVRAALTDLVDFNGMMVWQDAIRHICCKPFILIAK
jgi:hypothetical protein